MGAILAGHYHVVRPLGSGGFGQTFLARDSHLPGKPLCVVKQFKPRLNSANLIAAKRLFNLEAEVLYQLGNHEQIPRLLAHFEQDGEFYLVQEYIEGWSLDRELQQKHLSEAEVITLLKDILEVLAFVHAQNVIHRDIKPSNLMRRKADRKIVLIDFGAVKQVNTQSGSNSGQTNFTVAIGSPGYMPAEQQSSMPQFSSDVYAVGMIALQALTGTAVRDLPRDPNTGEIHPHELGISPELAAVLEKMVRYDYRQRYASATEALTAVQTLHPGQKQTETTGFNTVIPQSQFTETQIQPLQHTYDQDETLPPSSLPMGRSPFVRSAQPLSLLSNNYFSNAATISRAPAPTLSRQEYRNRQALLSKVKHYWIRGVLEASLHDQVMLVLGIETRPDAVASPWNITWETQQNSALTVPHGIPIIALFNQLGTGRTLLILGEPGAGKTTTLLELARDLIAQAEEDVDQLIPVVLNLSSWSAPTSIAEWVVKELNAKYQVPEKISRPWVEQQQLLLLLDGLDEVPLEYREACVVALNQFQQQYSTEMVVCSRMRDYEALPQRLAFQSAIFLRSLTLPQIHHYLNTLNVDLTGLRTLLNEDEALQELAESPLMLNIMVLAYQGVAAADVSEVLLVEERRRQLFNAYIECMFRRRNDGRYSPTQTIDWLSWLAKQLLQKSQTIILIEQIQPHWLANPQQRRWYRFWVIVLTVILMGIPFGVLTGGVTNTIIDGWQSGLAKSISNGLILGTTFGLIAGFSKPDIETVETLKWSWREARRNVVIGVRNGVLIGLIAGIVFGIATTLDPSLIPSRVSAIVPSGMFLGLMGGTTAGAAGGIIFGLTHGLRGSTIETKTVPNQGIWRTLKSAGIGAMIGGAINGTVIGVLYSLMLGWRLGIIYGLTYGFCGGFVAGFIFGGGQACLKHLVLRYMLYRDRRIPWNYSRFLNYAAEHVFLQKVGGGYIFIHRLVLEHFAHLRS